MALTRKDKVQLIEKYKQLLDGTKNLIAVKQFGIPVNEINKLRMDMYYANGKLMIIKKRIFVDVLKEKGYEDCSLDKLEGSVAMIFSYEDDYEPLKVISKYLKQWKKQKAEYGFDYLGGWFESVWKESDYVKEIADMPSREELLSKFAFMMNYPIQSFAQVVDQIAKSKQQGQDQTENKQEDKTEQVEEKVEAKSEDTQEQGEDEKSE